jgi:hypothetical protein
MDELLKLKTLLAHWSEHNDEHAESYCMWAEKTSGMGHDELTVHMRALCEDARKLRGHFEKALDAIPDGHGGPHHHLKPPHS